MKLKELFSHFKNIDYRQADLNCEVNLCNDSRKVNPCSVFVAIQGYHVNGHDYLTQAIQQGALALVVEDLSLIPSSYSGACVHVDQAKAALAFLAHKLYGEKSHQLFCGAVTGTNGKTSIVYMLEHLLSADKKTVGVMGTIDHHVKDHIWSSDLTTPDVIELHARIDDFCQLGAEVVLFEASSHALDQQRISEVYLDLFIFTNLTRDHLDYHQDMDSYLKAKELLFNSLPRPKEGRVLRAIMNKDDPATKEIKISDLLSVWTYGKDIQSDFRISKIKQEFSKTQFHLKSPEGEGLVELKVVGEYNVYNATAALAGAIHAGMSFDRGVQALKSFTGVPGRLQRVENDQGVHVFVDYAHTSQALESVLQSLNEIKKDQPECRIITLFGCGGDRDQGKRPLMGEVAARLSDLVVVTSDNPRTEDPEKIISDIKQGLSSSVSCFVEVDRKKAMSQALLEARSGDVVLIAGKGHEDYQIIGHDKQDFNDYEIAKELLSGLSS